MPQNQSNSYQLGLIILKYLTNYLLLILAEFQENRDAIIFF